MATPIPLQGSYERSTKQLICFYIQCDANYNMVNFLTNPHKTLQSLHMRGFEYKVWFIIVMSRQPHWFRTWTESPLRVTSQRSNQLSQRVRPTGEKLAGRLDCHIPPFLNGTRHPCLATRHFHQAREKHDNQSSLSELSMRWALPRPADEPPM